MGEPFDLIVIGAGPGGYVAAIRAAQLGMKVACADKNAALGGTCLNVGCIPSKALLDSSELYFLAQNRFAKHGIRLGDVQLDLAQMLERKNEVVKSLTSGIAFLFRKNKITFVQGTARLAGAGKVVVQGAETTSELAARHILLATGSQPACLPALPFDGVDIVSSTEALAFAQVPQHLLVVGAGAIGLELGSIWSRLGAQVTVLEFLPRILPLCDGELADMLRKYLARQKLQFHLGARVATARKENNQVVVEAEVEGKTRSFSGDKVLLAIGRRPCTEGLGLAEVGVALEEKTGCVRVDDNFATNIAGIYAVGDLIAGPMLAHKAQEEGMAVAEKLAGKVAQVNYGTLPGVVYTTPELAGVGRTEEQLQQEGVAYRVGKLLFAANGRARCLGESQGLVKVLTEAKTDRLLGVHILGPRASDLLAEAVLALEFGGCAEDIARSCHAHPTLSEVIGEAARAAWDVPLHS